MQNIHLGLKESLKEAMKNKDVVLLNVIRGLLTAFTNELVATGKTPQDTISDEEATKVIRRVIKQREDSISQFSSAGRMDLADEDTAQLEILKKYVPAPAGDDEVRKVVEKIKMEMGDIDKSKMGMLIGAVKKELGDRGDGNIIKRIIEETF